MQASVDLVKNVKAAYVEFHIMVLIPKTVLFRQAVAEGKATIPWPVDIARSRLGS